MRIEYLMYLCEVAKNGSINSSANNLNISQQGLNRALKSLEKEIGCPIFFTSNQGIALTPQGNLLVETSKNILAEWQTFQNSLHELNSKTNINSSLSLYVTPAILEYYVTNFLSHFSNHHPEISLNIIEGDHIQILNAIENGSADLGLFGIQYSILDEIFPEYTQAEHIKFFPLYQYKIAVLANNSSPISKYKSISLKTLLKYPIILPPHTSPDLENDLNYRWLKMHGEPQIKFATSSVNVYKSLISSGQTVGLTSTNRHGKINIPIEKELTIIQLNDINNISTVGYLYNTSRPITSALKILVESLKAFTK